MKIAACTATARRLGLLGFWFFFGKGLLWLASAWFVYQASR
ncbi:MAG: alanyl-tRNA synthetase [Gammaproteobacteria bacterium]